MPVEIPTLRDSKKDLTPEQKERFAVMHLWRNFALGSIFISFGLAMPIISFVNDYRQQDKIDKLISEKQENNEEKSEIKLRVAKLEGEIEKYQLQISHEIERRQDLEARLTRSIEQRDADVEELHKQIEAKDKRIAELEDTLAGLISERADKK